MMPVRRCNTIGRLLICSLLPVVHVQAEEMYSADQPSMDFLEYLGGVENEIDGELSSPVVLDLEAALVADNAGSEKIDVKAESEASNEASSEEGIDE